jgi:septum formation protein
MTEAAETFERLLLASGSARRHHLLNRAGVRFEFAAADVDETPRPGETPEVMVRRLAVAKATALNPQRGLAVLGCDTTVALDGQALGKPRDTDEALRMLRALSDRSHTVITAFCFSSWSTVLVKEEVVTRVFMRTIDGGAAAAYVDTGEPFGKAGAYAIQGAGGDFVDHIEGSYTNVMGLPVDEVIPHISRLIPAALQPVS